MLIFTFERCSTEIQKNFVPWFAWIPLVSTLSAKYCTRTGACLPRPSKQYSNARMLFHRSSLARGRWSIHIFGAAYRCTGRGATTCSQCVSDFCAAVCKVMSEKEITLPTAPEIKASADSFKEHTGMLGSASHIRILNMSRLLRRAGWKDVTFPDLQFMYSRFTFICPSQERLRCKNYKRSCNFSHALQLA